MNSYRRGLQNDVLVNPKVLILEKSQLGPTYYWLVNLVKLVKNLYYLVQVVTCLHNEIDVREGKTLITCGLCTQSGPIHRSFPNRNIRDETSLSDIYIVFALLLLFTF